MSLRVYDFRWKDEKTPYFEVCVGDRQMQQVLNFGTPLTIKVTGDLKCAGYDRDGEWQKCVNGGVEGIRVCEDCKRATGYPVAQYCDGFNTHMFNAEELESLNKPHYLYLALFDNHLIKIGVSSSSRGYMRQIEQGSFCCMVIAENMWGVPARQMEQAIRKSGVTDKVQSSQKEASIFPNMTVEEAQKKLEEIAAEVIPVAKGHKPEWAQFFLDQPKFLHFDEYYHLPEAQKIAENPHVVKLNPQESISGRLMAVKGAFILLNTEEELVAINGRKLRGYEVNFAALPFGLDTQGGFQGSLF